MQNTEDLTPKQQIFVKEYLDDYFLPKTTQEFLDYVYNKTGHPIKRKDLGVLGEIYNKKILPSNKDLYFILAPELNRVKIGIANSVQLRLQTLQTSNPYKLEAKVVVEFGGRGLEQHLHKVFTPYRVSGEWFKYEGEVKSMCEDFIQIYANRK